MYQPDRQYNVKSSKLDIIILALTDHEIAQTVILEIDRQKATSVSTWYEQRRVYSTENIQKFCEFR